MLSHCQASNKVALAAALSLRLADSALDVSRSALQKAVADARLGVSMGMYDRLIIRASGAAGQVPQANCDTLPLEEQQDTHQAPKAVSETAMPLQGSPAAALSSGHASTAGADHATATSAGLTSASMHDAVEWQGGALELMQSLFDQVIWFALAFAMQSKSLLAYTCNHTVQL